jgi:hypothetical protein
VVHKRSRVAGVRATSSTRTAAAPFANGALLKPSGTLPVTALKRNLASKRLKSKKKTSVLYLHVSFGNVERRAKQEQVSESPPLHSRARTRVRVCGHFVLT